MQKPVREQGRYAKVVPGLFYVSFSCCFVVTYLQSETASHTKKHEKNKLPYHPNLNFLAKQCEINV